MIINIQGGKDRFTISVRETTRIKDIRAIIKYLLSCRCDIALVFQGRYLRNGLELRDYGIANESTVQMEYKCKPESV